MNSDHSHEALFYSYFLRDQDAAQRGPNYGWDKRFHYPSTQNLLTRYQYMYETLKRVKAGFINPLTNRAPPNVLKKVTPLWELNERRREGV